MSQDSKPAPLERYTRILELLVSFPDELELTEVARVRRLAMASADTAWVATVVRPHLADMAAETDETCCLAKMHACTSVSSVLIEATRYAMARLRTAGQGHGTARGSVGQGHHRFPARQRHRYCISRTPAAPDV